MSILSCYDYSSNWIQALENASLISKYEKSKSTVQWPTVFSPVQSTGTVYQLAIYNHSTAEFPPIPLFFKRWIRFVWGKLTFLTVLSRILLLVFLKIKVINWLCKYKDTTHCCVCTSHNIYLERAEEDSKVTKTTTSGGVTGSQMTGMGGGV